MFLADAPAGPLTAVVTTLDGVTTILVAFIFVCLVLPSMVRHRSQFYAALACVALIIVVHVLIMMFDVVKFGGTVIGVLQLFALLLLVLCVGGLTVRELGGDMAKAYEVVRRGETEKEVIIPLPGVVREKGEGSPRKVYKVAPPPTERIIDPDDETEDHGIPLSS